MITLYLLQLDIPAVNPSSSADKILHQIQQHSFTPPIIGQTIDSPFVKNERYKFIQPEKKYQCNVCTYKSHFAKDLTKHMRTHTGEKPYECPICHHKTALPENLKRHMLTRHGLVKDKDNYVDPVGNITFPVSAYKFDSVENALVENATNAVENHQDSLDSLIGMTNPTTANVVQ